MSIEELEAELFKLGSIHHLAERELTDAAEFYDREREGLGGTFLTEINQCIEAILEHPDAGRHSLVASVGDCFQDSLMQFRIRRDPPG